MPCHPRAEDWITSPQIPSRFREARWIAANIAKLRGVYFNLESSSRLFSRNEFFSTWRSPSRRLPQKLRQLGDVRRDPSRLVFREQLGLPNA
jgi:hypothetical protein